jgi:hypothetical protein
MCITQVDPETGANASDNTLHFQLDKTQKSFRFDHVFASDAAQAGTPYPSSIASCTAGCANGNCVQMCTMGLCSRFWLHCCTASTLRC